MSFPASFPASFPDLSEEASQALLGYADLLRDVFPMKAAHRRHLADNIQELSSFLIEDRKEVLGRDYLHTPAALGAYLWYFLPWNLLRLTRLLGGLKPDLPEGANIVDLGAGPLTFVQALALARPDLLSRELHFYCLDTTPKPMREGRKLYHGLLNALGMAESARWKIHLVHAPWHVALKDTPRADMLVATNFMNELPWHRREPLSEQVRVFFREVSSSLRPDGQALFVEPGNRLGGKLITLLRESGVGAGWNVLGPCTHPQPCPMLAHRETSWCHFTVSTRGCPPWLEELSREAELRKRDVSLSYVHLAGPQGRRPDTKEDLARIISAEFPVPDREKGMMTGRYGCAVHGKVLILSGQGEAGTRSGDIVPVHLPEKPRHDPKSQALIGTLHPDKKPRRATRRPEEVKSPGREARREDGGPNRTRKK
ncbi:small ribosomal subunit Rsm22 family protein [Desulfonatronum thiosulfatophilum]|nr:small ribosomal subunit Rsm22 family protein [Desulfonatronum thiosulfatophilum]